MKKWFLIFCLLPCLVYAQVDTSLLGEGFGKNGQQCYTNKVNSFSQQIKSTVATGTAPFSVNSTTQVTNLNCGTLNGITSTGFGQISATNSWSGTNNFSIQLAANAGLVVAGGSSTFQIQNGAIGTQNSGVGHMAGSSTNGFESAGQGSTYDVSLLNKNNSVAIGIPTGTTNIAIAGVGEAEGFISGGGTTFTVSGCSASSPTGGSTAGQYTSGTSGTCTVTITMNGATGLTSPNGWSCAAADLTTNADVQTQTGSTATTATISGTTVSGDVINFHCIGY